MSFIFTKPRYVTAVVLAATGTTHEVEQGSYWTYLGAYGEDWVSFTTTTGSRLSCPAFEVSRVVYDDTPTTPANQVVLPEPEPVHLPVVTAPQPQPVAPTSATERLAELAIRCITVIVALAIRAIDPPKAKGVSHFTYYRSRDLDHDE